MRSSKPRSRNKSNRNRSVGNSTNRVFDSSGPEGKVRGTPAQIIEKYNQLARDAMLGNNPVAAENFQQHAEHYTRMLTEAQREQETRREQQEAQQRERQRERDANMRNDEQRQTPTRNDERREHHVAPTPRAPLASDPSRSPQPDLLDIVPPAAQANAPDNGLVETPESESKPESKPRRAPRKPRSRNKPASAQTAASPSAEGGENASPQTNAPQTNATQTTQPHEPKASQPDASRPDAPEAAE